MIFASELIDWILITIGPPVAAFMKPSCDRPTPSNRRLCLPGAWLFGFWLNDSAKSVWRLYKIFLLWFSEPLVCTSGCPSCVFFWNFTFSPLRLVNSSHTIEPYPSPDLPGEHHISTKIIRRPGGDPSNPNYDCYYYEILESEVERDRDIFLKIKLAGTGRWSTHYYRPFRLDLESRNNITHLVTYCFFVTWRKFRFVCSSPAMFIDFQWPQHPFCLSGAWVNTVIPSRLFDPLHFRAFVNVLPRADPLCNVSDCSLCCTELVPFLPGSFIGPSNDVSRYTFYLDYIPEFFPIIQRAYYGNILAIRKSNPVTLYLAAPIIFTGFESATLSVRFPFDDLSLFFHPVPIQVCGHPLSAFFDSITSDTSAWVPLRDGSFFLFYRNALPESLLHLAQNLVYLDCRRRDSEGSDWFLLLYSPNSVSLVSG